MKIIIFFLLFLISFGLINGYQNKDLKLIYIVTDNSFADPSSLFNPNNYTDINFKRNPGILSLLHITTFKDIKRLSVFIKNYYNSTDIDVEYLKDDIVSQLTGIILYETIRNTETSCESWQKRLNDKWNQDRVIYIDKSRMCNDVHLRNYSDNEGFLFLQNFIKHANSIKNNKTRYNVNKIFSANFVIMNKLIQRFNFSDADQNNRLSRSLMFELVYSIFTDAYEVQVAYYSGSNNDSTAPSKYLNFGNSKRNVTIEEFEQILNFNSQLQSCNKQISEAKYEPVGQQSKSLKSTNETESKFKTLSFSDNNYIKNQTNPARELDKENQKGNNIINEESSKYRTGENSSKLVQLSLDEKIGEANSDNNSKKIAQQHEEDFHAKVNKYLQFVAQSSILVEDDKEKSSGNKKISSLLLDTCLIIVIKLVFH